MELNQERLNLLWKEGFRPGFVALIIKEGKVLFLYQPEYDLWGFAQGGIKADEGVLEAINRSLGEDLGEEFVEHLDMRYEVVGEDRIEFPPGKMENGMKGKHYFFLIIGSQTEKIDLTKTIYSHARWASYEEALRLIEKIYQHGKQRMIKKAVEVLKQKQALI